MDGDLSSGSDTSAPAPGAAPGAAGAAASTPSPTAGGHPEAGRAVAYGLTAYGVWGVLPLYFLALVPAGAWEILGHRVLWSLLFCGLLLLARRRLGALAQLVRSPALLGAITLAGALIAVNWTLYVVAATSGHITDAALGYFLNPLVSIALGLVVLHERLRPLQIVAVVIGAIGGLYLAFSTGHVPWLAFGLAASFGLYGLIKNRMGAHLDALEGLTAETAVLALPAAACLWWVSAAGLSTFTQAGPLHTWLLVATGVITAVPLLLFGAAARCISLVSIGLMQFVAPIMQFICGLAVGEHMSTVRWIGFGIVWVALIVLVVDTVTRAATHRRLTRGIEVAPTP